MKPRILLLDSVPDDVVSALEAGFVLHPLWRATNSEAALREVATDIQGLITTWQSGFRSALLEMLPNLKVISMYGTGHQALDLDAAKSRGIVVTNTAADGTDITVAEYAIGLLLALARRIVAADGFVRAQRWTAGAFPPTAQFAGRTVGIVGLGYIGREIAKRANALGAAVLYTDSVKIADVSYRFIPDLVELARASDSLIVSCRGGPEVIGLIDENVLRALGPNGFYVHIAQSQIFNEAALLNALASNTIAGAAVDIFDNEPNLNSAFYDLDNIILSPHIASTTTDLIARRCELVANNLKAYFENGTFVSRLV